MNIPDEITNSQDVIDSRDIIARIEYLQGLRDDFQSDNELPDYPGFEESEEESLWHEWDMSDEGEELHNLEKLADDASQADDWLYGVTLIRDSYFQEYAEELVKDCGDLPQNLPPYIEDNIDWEGVVKDIQVDYFNVEFDDITYWVR